MMEREACRLCDDAFAGNGGTCFKTFSESRVTNEPRLSQVNKSTSQVDVQVLNLKLDELELASLRGDLQEAALHVNFDTRMGRGAVNVIGPRFSGLKVRCKECGATIDAALVYGT